MERQLSAPPAIGLERELSAAAKQWLSEQGLSATQVANVEAVLNKQGMPPETWLSTLKGIPHDELQGIARGDGADTPEPMMEDDDGAMTRTATPALPPAGMAGGGPPPDDDLSRASSLTRQHSARTEEFLNHRRKEAERGKTRMHLHRAKIAEFGEGPIVRSPCERFEVGMSDTIGHRRTMEDCMTMSGRYRGNSDEDLLAVFDGHGGQSVAEYCAIHCPRIVEQALAAGDDGRMATAIWPEAFKNLNDELEQELGEEAMESGSTAAIVVLKGDTLCVANVGDSRAVLECAHVPTFRSRSPRRPLTSNFFTACVFPVCACAASFAGGLGERSG